MLRRHRAIPDTTELVPYNAGYSSGWVVERYQIDLVAAAQGSPRGNGRGNAAAVRGARCRGDTHRNLQRAERLLGQTYKHILVPIWLLTYNYGARDFQAVINGYTGAIQGKYPKSWIKVTLLVAAVLVVVLVALSLGTHR